MKYCTQKMTEIHPPLGETVGLTHKVENGRTVISIKLEIDNPKLQMQELQNISINGRKLKNRSIDISRTLQYTFIDLGPLSKGKHHLDAILYFIKGDLPFEYTIDYAFEI
jgi:hypothetical protein